MCDAQRLLEMLIPLVYRPALKAAMLDLGVASTLASLLSEEGGGVNARASSSC